MAAETPSLDTIFCAAIEIESAEERADYVLRACGDDRELRVRVEELVAAHFRAGSFLEQPAVGPGVTGPEARAPAVESPGGETPGERIGPYKLLQQIGEGGMGTVWMAEQQEPVRRLVALKVIKAGMDSAQVVARFEAERQALALMDHPHIAKVLDADTTDTGRPFFVMELVKGTPITKYCDEHRLTPRQRLELFVPVCQAIQHAHQKGIIHRDVKPSNVLVAPYDGKPVVKVIDFGVAKATGQRLTERTLFTGFGAVVGTLEYMSPEQAELNNQDIDTRSDIYSLGVLLYELLTGSTPLSRERLKQAAFTEMLRLIREEEPPKPSTRLSSSDTLPAIAAARQTEPAKLTKLVRGELDWIVMKALEKDRNRRYETANGFAADVRRYLADEPVEACPPSAGYRLRKVARKYRRLLVTAAAFAVLLLLGTAVSTWQAVEATRAKTAMRRALDDLATEQERTKQALADATRARNRARHALNVMTDDVISDLFAKQTQLDDKQRAFLRKVLVFHQEFAAEQGDSEESRAVAADGQHHVAGVQAFLGEREAAVSSYLEAIRRREKLTADFPAVPEYRYRLAQSHLNLGTLFKAREEHQKAEAAYHQALDLYEKLAAEFPAVPEYREGQAQCHNNLGILLEGLGKGREAEGAFRRSLAVKAKLAADFPAVPGLQESLARGQINLGHLLRGLGERQKAEDAYRQALATLERLAGEFPAAHKCRHELASTYSNLGALLDDMGKRPEAEAASRRGVVLLEKLAADFPGVPQYRKELASSHRTLGVLLQRLRKTPEAEAAYRRALALDDQLAADFPTVPDYRQALASTLNNLAIFLMEQGKYPEAEATYRRVLALDEQLVADFPTVPAYRTGLAGGYVNFGNLLRSQQRAQDALEWYDKAIPLLETNLARDARLVQDREFLCNARAGRALALSKLQRYAEAMKDWDRAIALDQGPERPRLRLQKAVTLARAGDHAQAAAAADALTGDAQTPGVTLYNAARVYSVSMAAVKGDAQLQERCAAKALALLRRAQAAGSFKDGRVVELLRQDPDFEPLRQRPEFQKLLAELKADAQR
jgi:serine/threonine protein kinase